MTSIPYLVTPPAELPVGLADMRAHLRVVATDDAADLDAKQAGVVAMLDGWGGVLGRCIMPQEWAIDVTGQGPHLLPFPDAENIAAEADGSPLDVTVTRRGLGLSVAVSAASGDAVTITAEYAMPEPRRSAARSLVKLMVQREYDNTQGPEYDALTRTIQALITSMRWVRV
jgi:hypothetical protein